MENTAKLSTTPGPAQYHTVHQHDDSDTHSFDNQLPLDGSPSLQSNANMGQNMSAQAKRTILAALTVILLPMVGLSVLLLALILANKVDKQSGPLSFQQRLDTDDNAYYVNFNATALATISSWSATVAPLLAVATMTLASFPISRTFKDNSATQSRALPTPYQFSMILESLTGGIAAFFSFGKYRLWPHRAPFPPLLRSAFLVLTVSSIVGYVITGVDTWLHLVIETVNVEIASARIPECTFGRGMADVTCVNNISSFSLGGPSLCNVFEASTGFYLTGSPEAYKTLGSLSAVNAVRTVAVNASTFAFLGPATIPSNLDYSATTLAIGTHCLPISSKCQLSANSGSNTPFDCSSGFYGDLTAFSVAGVDFSTNNSYTTATQGTVWFLDPGLTRYANASFTSNTRADPEAINIAHNPYHLGVWAALLPSPTDQDPPPSETIYTITGTLTYLLNCTTTVYDMTYSWINGTISSPKLSVANATMGTELQWPSYLNLGKRYMDTAAYGAGAETTNQAIADAWSTSYSTTAMGLTAGFLSNRTNLLEQIRETRLVSRVSKVPLYFLIALNLLYAGIGLALAIIAMGSRPNDCNEVRERLSIVGLVAYAFEGDRARKLVERKRQMFAELSGGSERVGMERSMEGGWEYSVTPGSAKAG